MGATLTHGPTSGLIVETEAYSELNDEACHTFFRKSARSFVANNPPGAAYVYLNYGMYWLANVLVRSPSGERGFVLIRALEPLDGIELMKQRRNKTKLADLCSGPGKLTIALGIDGTHHEQNFLGKPFTLTPRSATPDILTGPRIGISKAKDLPWRFGLAANPHLSQPF
ncbi:MAG: DNA-3-methyladenine glycosylase [Verrucomicrobiota bacterium]